MAPPASGTGPRPGHYREANLPPAESAPVNQSDDQFYHLTESSPDAIYVGAKGRFTYVNPAALRLFGAASQDELLGQPIIERIHPDDRAAVLARIARLYESGESAPPLEETYLRLDGTPVAVEVSAVAFHFNGENGGLVFVRDITRRKRAETALHESELRFRQMFERNDAVMLLIEPESGAIEDANAAASRFYGYPVETLRSMAMGQINTLSPEALATERARAARQECSYFVFPHRLASGEVRTVEVRVSPFTAGDRLLLLSIVNDITASKLAEAELCRNQQLLRAIIDNSTAVIFVKDLQGRYLLINRRYAELFHVSNESIQGRTDHELFPAAVADTLRAADRQVLAAGAAQEFEEVIPHDDGLHTWLSLKFPLVDAGGQAYAVCGIATDISERKRAEAGIRALNQNLEQRVSERTRELHAKEAQLHDALALNENILITSAAGFSAYRQDGQCVMVNPALAELVGGTVPQLLAQNFHQLSSWRESGLFEAAQRVLAGGTHEEFERRFTSSFGRDIWVHGQFSRFASRGEPHLLLMLHDITAQRQATEALAERERAFRSLADNVPDNVIRYDLDGRILYLNKTLEVTLGCAAAELLGKNAQENFPDGRFAALDKAIRQVAASGESVDFEQVVPGPDGEPRYHAIRIVAEPGPDGQPVSVLAVGRDLTAQKIAEEELRLAASVFHSSAEGVLVTDADGIIVSVNPAFSEITGYTEAQALGQKPSLLRSDRQAPEFYHALWAALAREGHWQGEIWNRKKCGEAYLEWLTINRIDDNAGCPVRYVSVFHDITEMRRKDEHIHHLAFHDALTGLPNRTLMLDRLQNAVARARREHRRLSVTFIDLDRFKSVNDALGHDTGDLLLQEVARRVKERLRATDTVARLGGDEFVVLMEELKETGDCACLAQELITEIARPMLLRGHTVEVGASMGMAFFPEDGSDPLELMKRADMAMYAAKSAGRNTYRFFQQEMLEHTSQRLTLEMDLRRAIANRDLELHYQPKVALATGKPLGVEALVRWRHPIRGLLPPGEFIPLAEESNLIVDLDTWVLDEACRQAAEWRAAGRAVKIAVNVSARELEAGDLVYRIARLTAQHGITPADLEIELTESTVMANPENVAGIFARLRQLGATVAVDDFGTGYSSLAYLRRLPIDVLKIDRSFVMAADRDEEDAQIVRTILALGQALKLTVVAEGIETRGQAELLKSLGCDMAQGYFFSRPLPAREIEAWLEAVDGVAVEADH